MKPRVTRWAEICGALALALAAASCSSSSSPSSASAPPPAAKAKPEAGVPAGVVHEPPVSTVNPDVVEETPTYYVQRYKKADMVRVDEAHIRPPFMAISVPIYREDADYYYVRTEKLTPEEVQAAQDARKKAADVKAGQARAQVEEAAKTNPLIVTPEQFETLPAVRGGTAVSFQRAGEGLPQNGQWRQNIAVADIDGDGILDIVAPPMRMGQSTIHIFLGDGHGKFRAEPVSFVDAKGKPLSNLRIAYGGVAVADFDGDGRNDVALASHGDSIAVFLNRGGGKFEVVSGLPPSYSSQAIVAMDVNGDGKIDIVAGRDNISAELRRKEGKDYHQVRVFVNDGHGKFKSDDDAIRGACFSFNLFPIDLTGAGRRDLLTGCRFLGGWGLTWKNDGKGKFENELFEIIEQAAYHFGVAPGTFGPEHRTAFADLYQKQMPGMQAAGINAYYKDGSGWHKVAVWRQKGYVGQLTAVAMGDLNGDGLDDIVFPDRVAQKLRIFFQTKDGKFEESPESAEPPLNSPADDIRLADLDGDGRLDIVLSKSVYSSYPKDPGGIEVLLNRGSK
jgi:hypothetical protein